MWTILGYGGPSCYGATAVRTPSIDRLAEEGVLLTDAHSPFPACTPTCYSFLTARYSWREWLTRRALRSDATMLIEESRPTVASVLRSEGYYSAHIGRWRLGFGREEGYHKNREGQGMPNAWRGCSGGPDSNGDVRPGPLEVGFDYFFGLPIANSYPPYVLVENHPVVGLELADPIVRLESRYLGTMEGARRRPRATTRSNWTRPRRPSPDSKGPRSHDSPSSSTMPYITPNARFMGAS